MRDRIVAEKMCWRNKSVQADGGGVVLTSWKLSEAGHGASPSTLTPSVFSWHDGGWRWHDCVDLCWCLLFCYAPAPLYSCFLFLLCPIYSFVLPVLACFIVNTTSLCLPAPCFLVPAHFHFCLIGLIHTCSGLSNQAHLVVISSSARCPFSPQCWTDLSAYNAGSSEEVAPTLASNQSALFIKHISG